jgi:tRNA A-37 threonylcarbamoyl transferase component Bud32/membrane-associated phospholipid phosphatase
MIVLVVAATALLRASPGALRIVDHADTWALRSMADIRVSWLTVAMRGLKTAGSGWAITGLGLGTIAALMIFRRWRHLLVFLGAIVLMAVAFNIIYLLLSRPRPYGVQITAGWSGFSTPSAAISVVSAILVGLIYSLVVPGRPRNSAKWGVGALLLILVTARLYLAVDHPSDVLFGVVLGVGLPVALFRFFAPNDAFPVSYKRRGSTAHLDITGVRGEAIRRGVREQLGLTVLEISPFGEESSGGSTPLRLRVEGDRDTYAFAKLYSRSHVRADRWYKIWRTILYGRLEDEAAFQSVRRLVEYEDYALRLLYMSGLPVPTPYGIVELTPECEYLIVMELFEGAKEIGEAHVDERVIDEGLTLVRKLWDAGVAHRDIKPANLMVRNGKVLLIDVAFVEVRPSPWRQAVDLANMMLVLAVRSDAERVYERALRFFSAEEIAEAFSATRGVASPSQLRAFMKKDGRNLLLRFGTLTPSRRRIAIQRWSIRRVVLGAGMLAAIGVSVVGGVHAFLPASTGSSLAVTTRPECGMSHTMILMAQAVPSATLLPCIATLPSGWTFGGAAFQNDQAQFWLDNDRAGARALVVTLRPRCDVAGELRVHPDESGTSRFETVAFPKRRSYLFRGACATFDLSYPLAVSSLVSDVDSAIRFTRRSALVEFVRRSEGVVLCGADASCPG